MMDRPGSQSQQRERSRGPHTYPRASSRSSNGTTNTRMTPLSANSSSSQLGASPQQPTSHPHRFHSSGIVKPGTPRPPQLSREASTEPRQSVISSYLQEKLQRERKVEIDRIASRSLSRTSSDMGNSVEMRASQSSPVRTGTSDGRRRPRSSGVADPTAKKGMGVKEMEQTVSTLHKQNFDLKLELFHRRERQTVLEERIDGLEGEKRQMEDMNDKLVEELEKRDKAVEEAVAMIVLLEAQVEKLVTERAMVRQVDLDGYYSSRADPSEPPANMATPKPPDLAGHEADIKSVNRMPSFLSERSENTENLRNVYLGVRGSLLSLPRPSDGGISEVDNGHVNNLTSPSLSVLSESSFLSVYGRDNSQDNKAMLPIDDSSGFNAGSPEGRPRTRKNSETDEQYHDLITPTRLPRSNSITRTTGPGQFHSITDILDQGSPLQRLERLDRTFSLRTDVSRTTGNSRASDGKDRTMSMRTDSLRASGRDKDLEGRAAKSPSRKRAKEEKRDALRKVNTDASGVRLAHDQTLPPTPDTISTSTLRHYKNSTDTLSNEQGATNGFHASQPPSTSAFTSRKDYPNADFDNGPPVIQRPRSAGETTTSRKRGNAWDTDSEFEDDFNSIASTDDIWLRESASPNRNGGGRTSPDLFNFPPDSSGWHSPSMFGYGGRGSVGAAGPMCTPVDDLMPVQQALFASAGPPPPPNRRSSLHARTGSSHGSGSVTPRGQVKSRPQRLPEQANGYSWHKSDEPPVRPVSQPRGVTPQDPRKTKDSHYPPISGNQSRGRRLNSFFRRSLGNGSSVTESAPTSTTELTIAAESTKNPFIGTPSWEHRSNAMDDDRSSATPPPIMRSRVAGRVGSFDGENGGVMLDNHQPPTPGAAVTPMSPATPVTPATPITPGIASQSSTGAALNGTPTAASPPVSGSASTGRRKWLPGFGRTSTLRNRAS